MSEVLKEGIDEKKNNNCPFMAVPIRTPIEIGAKIGAKNLRRNRRKGPKIPDPIKWQYF